MDYPIVNSRLMALVLICDIQIFRLVVDSCSLYADCESCVSSQDLLGCVWCAGHCVARSGCQPSHFDPQQPYDTHCPPVISHVRLHARAVYICFYIYFSKCCSVIVGLDARTAASLLLVSRKCSHYVSSDIRDVTIIRCRYLALLLRRVFTCHNQKPHQLVCYNDVSSYCGGLHVYNRPI